MVKQTVVLDCLFYIFIYYCRSIVSYSKDTHCFGNPMYDGPEMKTLARHLFQEGVRSYWMTLRTGEDNVSWTKLYIALCGGIVLEEALDPS